MFNISCLYKSLIRLITKQSFVYYLILQNAILKVIYFTTFIWIGFTPEFCFVIFPHPPPLKSRKGVTVKVTLNS